MFLFQVCLEGNVEQLPDNVATEYFNRATLPHQIREVLGVRGKPVDWNVIKKKHDKILCNVLNGKVKLERPCTM